MCAFQVQLKESTGNGILKVQLLESDTVLSYRSVISLWQQSEAFRSFYIEFLSSVKYTAYRWETPPLSTETVDQSFEFVIIESPELDVLADAEAFSDYFSGTQSEEDIVAFPNLGRDAWLVVPCPKTDYEAYSHLAVFSRRAPDYQNHELWQRVGLLVSTQLSRSPKWLNTAGGGVAWLHVRLDSRPKYYCYRPYKINRRLRV